MNLNFNLFGSDGKRFVRRKNGERLPPQYVKKTVKFGEGRTGEGNDFFSGSFHGNINASVYAILHLRKRTVETPIFMQDNAPCHKAKIVLNFLEAEVIAVMKWPPQIPDMKPIENVWKIVSEKAQNRNPQNIDDLWCFLKKIVGMYHYHLL